MPLLDFAAFPSLILLHSHLHRRVHHGVRDGGAVRALVDRFAPDIWIHHAGHAVDYASLSYDQALGDSVNVAPLDAIFRALAGSRGGVIVTGSSAEYAASDRANREDETEAPEMPYGRSKKSETERAREWACCKFSW